MNALNFLYYSLGVGFLVFVGFASYTLFNLSKTLKTSTSILLKVDEITKDVESLKDIIKNGIIYLLGMFSRIGVIKK